MIQDLRVAALGHQPRLHRPEPVVRALRRRRPSRLPALRPRPGAGRDVRPGARDGAPRPRGARRRSGCRATRRRPARSGIHVYVPIVRGPDAEGGVDVRQGARAASSRRAHPTLITAEYRIAQAARRAACSSTTTRTPGAARSRRSTRCGRSPRATRLDAGDVGGGRAGRRRSRTSASTTCRRASAAARRPLEAAARGARPLPPRELPVTLPTRAALLRRWRRSSSRRSRRAPTGSTSRSGTASAASPFATATRSSCSRRPASRSRATFPKLVEQLAALRAARFVLDGEIVVPVGRSALVRRPAAAHPSGGEPGRKRRREPPAAATSCSTCSPTRRAHRSSSGRCASGAARSKRFAARRFAGAERDPALALDRTSAPRRDDGSRGGRRARRRDREARWTRPTGPGERTRRCRRSSACAPPTASSADFATPRGSRVVGSLLLGLYDRGRRCCTTSASPRASPRPSARRSRRSSRRSWRRPGSPAARRAARADGPRSAAAQWEPLAPSSSSRCGTTISRGDDSATARGSCAGGPTRRRASARSAQVKQESGVPPIKLD